MVESEVIGLAEPRRGHFDLGTGYHGDLWLDLDALFLRPARLRPYVRWLGDRLAEHGIDAVSGPAEGGAFLALALADLRGAAFLPARRCSSGQSPGLAGYCLPDSARNRIGGWRVAVADDAINAGTATRACFDLLRDSGAIPVAVTALLAVGGADAMVAATMSLPFYAVATIPSQVWPARDCPLCGAKDTEQ